MKQVDSNKSNLLLQNILHNTQTLKLNKNRNYLQKAIKEPSTEASRFDRQKIKLKEKRDRQRV